jgi:pimeloyl-ACP methyl ester carboxylesterase
MVDVPGATLYTETRGSGPLLLFIVGGNGDPGVFVPVADKMADEFTVVTYARRGFALSAVESAVEDSTRLSVDVSDAVALIREHGDQPAYVFGSSSGAIVALELAATHPRLVTSVVAHEPPILSLLDDGDDWRTEFDSIYATYVTEGLWPALRRFGDAIGMGGSGGPPPASSDSDEYRRRSDFDMKFFFEHEFRQYPAYVPDFDALTLVASQIVPAGGKQSRLANAMPYRPAVNLAKLIGRELVEFSGGHVGYVMVPSEFAAQLRVSLAREG